MGLSQKIYMSRLHTLHREDRTKLDEGREAAAITIDAVLMASKRGSEKEAGMAMGVRRRPWKKLDGPGATMPAKKEQKVPPV